VSASRFAKKDSEAGLRLDAVPDLRLFILEASAPVSGC